MENPSEITNWMYIVANAIGSTCDQIILVLTDIVPVALPVGAAYFAIRYGWRSAKGLTR